MNLVQRLTKIVTIALICQLGLVSCSKDEKIKIVEVEVQGTEGARLQPLSDEEIKNSSESDVPTQVKPLTKEEMLAVATQIGQVNRLEDLWSSYYQAVYSNYRSKEVESFWPEEARRYRESFEEYVIQISEINKMKVKEVKNLLSKVPAHCVLGETREEQSSIEIPEEFMFSYHTKLISFDIDNIKDISNYKTNKNEVVISEKNCAYEYNFSEKVHHVLPEVDAGKATKEKVASLRTVTFKDINTSKIFFGMKSVKFESFANLLTVIKSETKDIVASKSGASLVKVYVTKNTENAKEQLVLHSTADGTISIDEEEDTVSAKIYLKSTGINIDNPAQVGSFEGAFSGSGEDAPYATDIQFGKIEKLTINTKDFGQVDLSSEDQSKKLVSDILAYLVTEGYGLALSQFFSETLTPMNRLVDDDNLNLSFLLSGIK